MQWVVDWARTLANGRNTARSPVFCKQRGTIATDEYWILSRRYVYSQHPTRRLSASSAACVSYGSLAGNPVQLLPAMSGLCRHLKRSFAWPPPAQVVESELRVAHASVRHTAGSGGGRLRRVRSEGPYGHRPRV